MCVQCSCCFNNYTDFSSVAIRTDFPDKLRYTCHLHLTFYPMQRNCGESNKFHERKRIIPHTHFDIDYCVVYLLCQCHRIRTKATTRMIENKSAYETNISLDKKKTMW